LGLTWLSLAVLRIVAVKIMDLFFQASNKKDKERINSLWAGPVPNPCSGHNQEKKKKKAVYFGLINAFSSS